VYDLWTVLLRFLAPPGPMAYLCRMRCGLGDAIHNRGIEKAPLDRQYSTLGSSDKGIWIRVIKWCGYNYTRAEI